MNNFTKKPFLFLIAWLGLLGQTAQAQQLVTYQGSLKDSGVVATGLYDIRFTLYDAPVGGVVVDGPITQEDVPVQDGVFSTELAFGAGAFNGQDRWLEVALRDGASMGGFEVLQPRQRVTGAPVAHISLSVAPDGVGTLALRDNAVTGAKVADGSITAADVDSNSIQLRVTGVCGAGEAITAVNADGSVTCASGAAGNDWSLTGNAITPGQFLGTTNNQPLELAVNNKRVVRIEPETATDGPNWLGGYSGNSITAGVTGATIGGGGAPDDGFGNPDHNRVTDNYGTIAGGWGNQAGDAAGTTDDRAYATVGGGSSNTASGFATTVAGGAGNTASNTFATVSGGVANNANGGNAAVGGGYDNTASGTNATVGGGSSNTANGARSTVGGGRNNTAGGLSSVVGGGENNQVSAAYGTIAGGGPAAPSNPDATNNRVFDEYGTIGGGGNNRAGSDDGDTTTGAYATVGGGVDNTASGLSATVGGGSINTASDLSATVGGGYGNTASGATATVGGGYSNTASGTSATVGGGAFNTASGGYATVPGGRNNSADGNYSFATGRRAKANRAGCFVWGDSTNIDIACNTVNRTVFRSTGGFYIYTNSNLTTGAYLSAGSGSWSSLSDRNAKENITPVDPQAVLEQVAQLPIATWNYKAQDDSVRHMGPMAQDFYAAFGLGMDDRHISTVDASGVALAAIQALARLNEEQRQQLAQQAAEADLLKQQLADQRERIVQLERDKQQLRELKQQVAEVSGLKQQLAAQSKQLAEMQVLVKHLMARQAVENSRAALAQE